MASKHTILLLVCIVHSIIHRLSHAQNTDLWWCGSTHSEAASECSQACPTGVGCPAGQICFSGITACTAEREGSHYCGFDANDAKRCGTPCPSGRGCPQGEACWMDVTCDSNSQSSGSGSGSNGLGISWGGNTDSFSSSFSSSSSSTSSLSAADVLGGKTGAAAVEATFLEMKDAINNNLFLYETPMMEWIPSTVYRFDAFFDGLKIMHEEGVAGMKVYLGGDCDHCHMYGLVNVAAFLAQAMKETIRYDACDENSWDRVGAKLMYPISNSCGQLGQSYQDYHCSEEERHMECEVDPQMTITAVTNAKWWGAPGPLKCGPKSLYPQTGYWDYLYTCDNKWADPPVYCDAYEGQTGGGANNDEAYPNAAGRTDVEGCCWWGRGVIQTSGVCNFGKLNYFLGKRAADEGRESRYPGIDFCRDPEAICSSEEHQELKWIAGFFYWISEVQRYDSGGWNYIEQLHKFVDDGLEGDAFINAVSGIVNRGCHNPPCGTGELDGGPERASNFLDIIKEMKFSFVEVVPQPKQPPPSPPPPQPVLEVAADVVSYSCAEYRFDPTDTTPPPSTEVTFDYEIHNGIDLTVGDALRDVKQSILSDIARRMGCSKTSRRGRKLQEEFGSIISLRSRVNDLPDPDASGCLVEVETDDPTTCTPVNGGFQIYAKPGTSESSLAETSESLKDIIRTSMGAGSYETDVVETAVYIGVRDSLSGIKPSAPVNAQSEGDVKIAIYALACFCLVLMCLLWFTWWTLREKRQREKRMNDEEQCFNRFMMEKEENEDNIYNMAMAPPQDYPPQSQNRPMPPQRQRGQREFVYDDSEEALLRSHAGSRGSSIERRRNSAPVSRHRQRANSRGSSLDRRASAPQMKKVSPNDEPEEETTHSVSSSGSSSSSSVDSSVEDVTPAPPPRPQSQRSKSAPRFDSVGYYMQQRNLIPPSRNAASEGGSVSSDGTYDDSSGDSSSEGDAGEDKIPAVAQSRSKDASRAYPPPRRASRGAGGHNKSMDSLSNGSSAREERQKRMAQARARAARRRSSVDHPVIT